MTEEYYQSLQAEFKDFVDTCCESYPIFRKWSSFMTWADGIEQKIAQLTAENERLCSLLHDINSQLVIATDLGSKRWQALNDIYLNGEKHNANWCKRTAQKGLGIR